MDRTDRQSRDPRAQKLYYKCSVCGVLHDGNDGAPKSCVKCDNDTFYKVYK